LRAAVLLGHVEGTPPPRDVAQDRTRNGRRHCALCRIYEIANKLGSPERRGVQLGLPRSGA
jgi:hypothetical protein